LKIWDDTTYTQDIDVNPIGNGAVSLYAYDDSCFASACGVELATTTLDGLAQSTWSPITFDWDAAGSPHIGKRLGVEN